MNIGYIGTCVCLMKCMYISLYMYISTCTGTYVHRIFFLFDGVRDQCTLQRYPVGFRVQGLGFRVWGLGFWD